MTRQDNEDDDRDDVNSDSDEIFVFVFFFSMMRWILFNFNHYDDSESDIIGLTYKVNRNYECERCNGDL